MVRITIRVDKSANDFYTLHNVRVFQVPQVGELVDLSTLVGLNDRVRREYVPVKKVLHSFANRWWPNNPVIVFEAHEIPVEILDRISNRWIRTEISYCRRER